jgi:oxygen-independent coproporphyrinogen-3 oxidase
MTPFGYIQNNAETGAWSRMIKSGNLPITRGHEFVSDDILRASVIQEIMCSGQADLDAIGASGLASKDWYADALPQLKKLSHDGIISFEDGKISVTSDGPFLARIAASAFDKYLTQGAAKHSAAV